VPLDEQRRLRDIGLEGRVSGSGRHASLWHRLHPEAVPPSLAPVNFT
jgi:hypothetical protein